jgi:LuxR family transcriptional regulator, maltose regulon positive regulatory protein
MVDELAVSPRQLAAAEQDTLLATKLHVPLPRPDRVPRPRLTELLDRQPRRGLVLVCAPAGYGKSTLLAEWTRRGGRTPAWLSLDAGDNDPTRFWRHLLAAIDQVHPGTGLRFGMPVAPSAPGSFQAPATALINELAAEPDDAEVLLVLDDYHLIDAPQVHELVDFLLAHRPPSLRLVLASRADPPLALARLRARDELTELRVADLRFSAEEAATLLHRAAVATSVDLPSDAVATISSRADGWAVGLQLAALSLRGHPDVAGFVAAFTGSHRHILDYLAEEVLEQQSDDVRTFLAETSVLERLSGPLCDAVTGRTDSQAMLERLERAGLFLIPMDEVRGWWRYHHLFADLLRVRLGHDAARAANLHRAAATWYTKHGLADDAIHHSFAAGDTLSAARLVEAHFDTVFNLRGEEATTRRWLPALPDDLVRSRPRLLLAQAQMAGMRGDAQTMARLVDAAEQADAHTMDEPFEPTSGRAGSLLMNLPALIALHHSYLAQLRGDADSTAAHAAQARTLAHDDEPMLTSIVDGFLAMAEWLRGRLSAAEQAFAASMASRRAVGVPTHIAWGYWALARIQCARGRLDAAVATCRQAIEFMSAPGRRPLPAVGPAHIGLAEVAYQRNDLDVALEHLDEGIALCRQFVDARPLAAGLVRLAWVRQAVGDPDGALDAIGEAQRFSLGPAGLLNPVPAQSARLLVAQGNLDAAARWTEHSGLSTDVEPEYAHEPGQLVLARVLLGQGRPDEARGLLDRLEAAAANQRRTGSIIEISALRAEALAASGDERAALNTLAEALRLAYRQGHVRVFTDEGAPMSALLELPIAAERTGHVAAAVPFDYLVRVQGSFAKARSGRTTPAGCAALVDPLTGRELEVLDLIAGGNSNQAIAAQLVVSIDTVKKHVSHILDKLGASNRTEAVARGRALGLSK